MTTQTIIQCLENSSGSFSKDKQYSTRCSLSSQEKIQNYFPYRSAEYQKRQLLSSKGNSAAVIDEKSNVQDDCRYRRAVLHNSNKPLPLLDSRMSLPCYSRRVSSNENEYSRYRDSRSPRKPWSNQNKVHFNCRGSTYNDQIERFPVPDNKVSWNTIFLDYHPVEFTTDRIQRNSKADPIDPAKIDKFNQLDKKIDRRSFTGIYSIDSETNRPRNPIGRTGVTGRGRLYYWGPNHAGDPVVTRWHRDKNGKIIYRRNSPYEPVKPVLEFVAIERKDTHQWALPGGMVDPGEDISQTIKREFQEEAIRDGIDQHCIDQLFANGYPLYQWYMDDPRNTDNAWIESVAIHYHDESGDLTKNLCLNAGDDADKVVWCPIDRHLQLYAGHKDILRTLIERLDAFW